MNKYTAVVIGATGLIGHHLLKFLLADDDFEAVKVLTRRGIGMTHPKLTEEIVDFDNFEQINQRTGAGDIIFCCIGTTQKKVQGNKEEYKKIDYGIPVNMAKIAYENGFKKYLFVSSVGADANSRNFYLQLKGQTEEAISSLPFQSVHIFRPSILLGKRDEYRAGEETAKKLMKFFSRLFFGKFKKYRAIEALDVAKAMANASKQDITGVKVYEFEEIMERAANTN